MLFYDSYYILYLVIENKIMYYDKSYLHRWTESDDYEHLAKQT